MTSRQRAGGAVLAVIGALGVTASAYLDWFRSRDATDIPLERLFQTDVSDGASSYWNSLALPLAVVTVVGVLGALMVSRFILVIGWLIGVATLVLFIVMQSNDDAFPLGVGDLQAGVWVCGAALIVMMLGIGSMGSGEAEQVVVIRDDERSDTDL